MVGRTSSSNAHDVNTLVGVDGSAKIGLLFGQLDAYRREKHLVPAN